MLKNIYMLSLILSFAHAIGGSNAEKTDLLRAEVAAHKNPHIAQETHPTLYALVQELSSKAGITMPEYITLYDIFYAVLCKETGTIHSVAHNISGTTDIMGDIYLCSELFETLSYDEIRSAIALVVAEKALHKKIKAIKVGIGSYLTLFALSQAITKEKSDRGIIAVMSIFPALLAAHTYAQNMQKSIDLKAAELVGIQNIINCLKKLNKVQLTYSKENVLSRLFSETIVGKTYNAVFYPIRPYRLEERIRYLQKIA